MRTKLDTEQLPHVDRAIRRASWSGLLDRVMADCPSEAQVARDLGAPRNHVRKWRDRESPQVIPISDVEALPPVARTPLVERLAKSLGCTLAKTDSESEISDLSTLGELASRAGAVISQWSEAVSDGVLSRQECADLEKTAAELRRLVAGLEEKCRSVVEDGSREVRLVRG